MSKTEVLNEHIYNLLIVMNFDHFTINELVCVLENVTFFNIAKEQLTRLAYRQIGMLEKKAYLKKSKEKRGRSVIYSKTPSFNTSIFVSRPSYKLGQYKQDFISNSPSSISLYNALSKEKSELEDNQAISLSEMEKYKELLNRYPKERAFIEPFYNKARIQSTKIQGDLEAVSKLLRHYSSNMDTFS